MHSHLHTAYNKDCEDIINALEECHARGFLWKAVGMCNDVKRDVNKCLGAQRAIRTAKNREEAKVKRAQIKEKWNEIDENS